MHPRSCIGSLYAWLPWACYTLRALPLFHSRETCSTNSEQPEVGIDGNKPGLPSQRPVIELAQDAGQQPDMVTFEQADGSSVSFSYRDLRSVRCDLLGPVRLRFTADNIVLHGRNLLPVWRSDPAALGFYALAEPRRRPTTNRISTASPLRPLRAGNNLLATPLPVCLKRGIPHADSFRPPVFPLQPEHPFKALNPLTCLLSLKSGQRYSFQSFARSLP